MTWIYLSSPRHIKLSSSFFKKRILTCEYLARALRQLLKQVLKLKLVTIAILIQFTSLLQRIFTTAANRMLLSNLPFLYTNLLKIFMFNITASIFFLFSSDQINLQTYEIYAGSPILKKTHLTCIFRRDI